MKVENFYNKNQFIIRGEGKNIFQSYDSTIAIIEDNKITLGINWDYSHTTLKYLYLFFEQYANLYELDGKANKKQYIYKLIDDGIIEYDKELK